ncbi:hypothetical protein Vafri_14396 [Volvox africanus]|uniref:Uncharacterized protein n=2 Tax=Volvox africanus TaxID=51714 RepID=A0A8J4BEV6_9CHLO|nr:hypothetical protein Vafri_14396 [Volvox africanus]
MPRMPPMSCGTGPLEPDTPLLSLLPTVGSPRSSKAPNPMPGAATAAVAQSPAPSQSLMAARWHPAVSNSGGISNSGGGNNSGGISNGGGGGRGGGPSAVDASAGLEINNSAGAVPPP